MMTKKILYLVIILLMSHSIFAQNIRVEIEDNSEIIDFPFLYIINNMDTITLNNKNYNFIEGNNSNFDNSVFMRYKRYTFNLGKLDTITKRILLVFNQNAGDSCYAVNKVYGDIVQSDFGYSSNCKELHNIYIYTSDFFKGKNKPVVKIRRKKTH